MTGDWTLNTNLNPPRTGDSALKAEKNHVIPITAILINILPVGLEANSIKSSNLT